MHPSAYHPQTQAPTEEAGKSVSVKRALVYDDADEELIELNVVRPPTSFVVLPFDTPPTPHRHLARKRAKRSSR
jgi:hypothetical protein